MKNKSGYCLVTREYCASLDYHHIIPTAYGGSKKGKTIALRPDIHQTIHRCASNPLMKDDFLSSLPPEGKKIALFLIQAIVKAKTLSKESVAPKRISLIVSDSSYQKLKSLAEDKGISINKLLVRFIESI